MFRYFVFLFLLVGCSPDLIACPQDAKVCSDGSVVVREGPNCEFADCPSLEKFECLERSDVCIEIYDPVCGWFSDDVQCVTYPCAVTFSNSCFACGDETVEYWTPGECPDSL